MPEETPPPDLLPRVPTYEGWTASRSWLTHLKHYLTPKGLRTQALLLKLDRIRAVHSFAKQSGYSEKQKALADQANVVARQLGNVLGSKKLLLPSRPGSPALPPLPTFEEWRSEDRSLRGFVQRTLSPAGRSFGKLLRSYERIQEQYSNKSWEPVGNSREHNDTLQSLFKQAADVRDNLRSALKLNPHLAYPSKMDPQALGEREAFFGRGLEKFATTRINPPQALGSARLQSFLEDSTLYQRLRPLEDWLQSAKLDFSKRSELQQAADAVQKQLALLNIAVADHREMENGGQPRRPGDPDNRQDQTVSNHGNRAAVMKLVSQLEKDLRALDYRVTKYVPPDMPDVRAPWVNTANDLRGVLNDLAPRTETTPPPATAVPTQTSPERMPRKPVPPLEQPTRPQQRRTGGPPRASSVSASFAEQGGRLPRP